MRKLVIVLGLLMAGPALAEPSAAQFWAVVGFYVVYAMIAVFLVGWSFLVTALLRTRVELTARVLQQRPLASFFMGLLSLGWLLLSLVIAKSAGPVGGLLVVGTVSVLILCALVGMPAILIGLGRRASWMFEGALGVPRQLVLGALLLFAAGGLPWLGYLLLAGVFLWSLGGAVLGFFSGELREAYGTTIMEALPTDEASP